MKLTELFGEYTRPDFVSWLMTEEGQRHINEVFAPADTELNSSTSKDHKFGRCVWLAMQVLSRPFTPEIAKDLFEYSDDVTFVWEMNGSKHQSVMDFLFRWNKNGLELKWKDVELEDILKSERLWV